MHTLHVHVFALLDKGYLRHIPNLSQARQVGKAKVIFRVPLKVRIKESIHRYSDFVSG
jgi:hypothetical protein